MVDKNKIVVCCWLATSAIMLSEKKKRKSKMWSKKWYLKRNMSCDAHLLNELLETDVPWDDAIVVSAGKLRKLLNSLSALRISLCEGRLERAVLRPALLPVKTAQFTHFFLSGMTSHSEIAQFNWECIGRFTVLPYIYGYDRGGKGRGPSELKPEVPCTKNFLYDAAFNPYPTNVENRVSS